jgi:hypothetical protein
VVFPVQQRPPQFLLQIPDLPGEGGLGEVEIVGRSGDAALPSYRQKVAQDP